MKVAANTVVTMTYVLHRETVDGEVIQEVKKDKPFEAVFGHGMLLPKFEENLAGKEPGDTFSFGLTPKEGYGEPSEENIVEVDKNIFVEDGKLNEELCRVGAQVWFNTNNGPVSGKILKVGLEKVTVDFNHELAGVPLYFTGEILDVRMVSEKDFDMGCGCGCEHDDCGCGHDDCHCGDDCDCGHGHDDCGCGCHCGDKD